MKICLFCFSDSGASLALKLCDALGTAPENVHTIPKFADKYGFTAHSSVCADMGKLFGVNDALIFIGACGIAVREIAPHIKNKTVDPAVIVIDDRGRYVIPILSGHIGGANALAERIAEIIGAAPIITTATDGAGRFSCDAWAKTHGCAVSSMKLAKDFSAEILTRDLPVTSEYELPALPNGLTAGDGGDIGLYIGVYIRDPYDKTLRLVPRVVTVGMGCRRGVSAETVIDAAESILTENGVDIRAVREISSIDVKKDETGLFALAERWNVPIRFLSAEELAAVPGDFSESEFVRKTVGVGNVCERAAASDGGKLIVGKTAKNGVTVAVAVHDWRIEF